MSKLLIELNQANIRKSLENLGIKGVNVAPKPNPFSTAKADDTIEKGINIGGNSENDFSKGFGELKELLSGSLQTQESIIKGLQAENNTLNKTLNRVLGRIEALEKQPQGRKSVLAGAIEKGFDNTDGLNSNIPKDVDTVLSMSKNKKEIVQVLRQKANFGHNDVNLEKGLHNLEYTNALVMYQTSNALPADILVKLKTEERILLTK